MNICFILRYFLSRPPPAKQGGIYIFYYSYRYSFIQPSLVRDLDSLTQTCLFALWGCIHVKFLPGFGYAILSQHGKLINFYSQQKFGGTGGRCCYSWHPAGQWWNNIDSTRCFSKPWLCSISQKQMTNILFTRNKPYYAYSFITGCLIIPLLSI